MILIFFGLFKARHIFVWIEVALLPTIIFISNMSGNRNQHKYRSNYYDRCYRYVRFFRSWTFHIPLMCGLIGLNSKKHNFLLRLKTCNIFQKYTKNVQWILTRETTSKQYLWSPLNSWRLSTLMNFCWQSVQKFSLWSIHFCRSSITICVSLTCWLGWQRSEVFLFAGKLYGSHSLLKHSIIKFIFDHLKNIDKISQKIWLTCTSRVLPQINSMAITRPNYVYWIMSHILVEAFMLVRAIIVCCECVIGLDKFHKNTNTFGAVLSWDRVSNKASFKCSHLLYP